MKGIVIAYAEASGLETAGSEAAFGQQVPE